MKNKSPLLVIICLFILMAGCSANNNNLGNNTIPGKEEEEYGKYSHSGRIVKIDNNGYQVKNDEGVNFFNVGEKSLNNFYVGEYVRLNSLDGKIYDAALDEKYDYTSVFNTADFLDEANKLELKVVDISRDITGAMRISGRASDNREYDIAAGADTVTNFAHSTLKVNDEISVYSKDISGSMPAVVEAQAVLKNETQAILKNAD
ncbi:MAG: hypothetical protein KBA50_03630 [Sedimentibacter sp.]|nr:hypothetical protein [Sedimentibacter sp.]